MWFTHVTWIFIFFFFSFFTSAIYNFTASKIIHLPGRIMTIVLCYFGDDWPWIRATPTPWATLYCSRASLKGALALVQAHFNKLSLNALPTNHSQFYQHMEMEDQVESQKRRGMSKEDLICKLTFNIIIIITSFFLGFDILLLAVLSKLLLLLLLLHSRTELYPSPTRHNVIVGQQLHVKYHPCSVSYFSISFISV